MSRAASSGPPRRDGGPISSAAGGLDDAALSSCHRDRADQLILGHQRLRELKVQRQLDRAISHPNTPQSMIAELKRMVALRRGRIKDVDAQAQQLGLAIEQFPGFEVMAAELGRLVDVVPYASASEVSHSVVSAATDGYTTSRSGDDGGLIRLVALHSESPSDRLGYAGCDQFHEHDAVSQTPTS